MNQFELEKAPDLDQSGLGRGTLLNDTIDGLMISEETSSQQRSTDITLNEEMIKKYLKNEQSKKRKLSVILSCLFAFAITGAIYSKNWC